MLGVALALIAVVVLSPKDDRKSLAEAMRTSTTVPGVLPVDVPLRAGPVVVPGGDGVRCRSVSGGPTPGLYCLVTFLVRANDPRLQWVGAEVAYDEAGPWTLVVVDRLHDGDEGSTDDLLLSTVDLRAPSRVYLRGFATFDDGEPFLPRSSPSLAVLVDLAPDGTLNCAHPHEIENSEGTTTHLCAFSGDENFSD